MDRRDFLKFTLTLAAGFSGVVVIDVDEALATPARELRTGEIGRVDGIKYYVWEPWEKAPEPDRPRQKVGSFIHRKAGHYGF